MNIIARRLAAAVTAVGLLAAAGAAPVLAQDYTVRFAAGFPPTTPQGRTAAWWIEQIEARSEGRIKVQPYWIGSLVASNEILGAVQDGVVDIGVAYTIAFPGELPLTQLGNLPFLTRDPWVMQRVWADLMDEFPALTQELERNNVVYLANTPTGGTGILSKEPVQSLGDMEGLKTFTIGVYSDAVSAGGANPVSLAWSESYEALQHGVVDSAVMYPMSILANKFNEVTSHFTYVGETGGLGQDLIFALANRDFWDDLPDDLKAVVAETTAEAEEVWISIWRDVIDTDLTKLEKGDGVSPIAFYTLDEEGVEAWRKSLGDPLQTWAEANARLADTAAIVARYKELEAKYEAELAADGYPETRKP